MIRYANLADAQHIAREWDAIPSTLTHLSDSGSSVFQLRNAENNLQIFRLTDATLRTREQVQAELEFLAHLKKESVSVAAGVRTTRGAYTSVCSSPRGEFIASVVEYAQGIHVERDSQHWNTDFFRAWGRNLAQIHHAAELYNPPASAPRLWQWDDEILFQAADELLPRDDKRARVLLNQLLSECRALPRSTQTFGLIHADHGPQNFRYDPVTQKITAFDFGNACYHWFVCDVAIAFSTFRTHPQRAQIQPEMLAGYAEIRALPDDCQKQIPLFTRLRALYVYLNRLYTFGKEPNAAQEKTLEQLQTRLYN